MDHSNFRENLEERVASQQKEIERLRAELTQWQAWGHRAGIRPAEIHYEEAEAAETGGKNEV